MSSASRSGRCRPSRTAAGGTSWNGSEGPAAARVRRLIAELARELGLAVRGVDERLSTVEATEIWRRLSPRRQRACRTVDSLAAALILERFLRGE